MEEKGKGYEPFRPFVTVDVILFGLAEQNLEVLLIQRKNPPFQGHWAFPGGFIEPEERCLDSAVREMEEETGVQLSPAELKFLGIADKPDRDPRGRSISTIYFTVRDKQQLAPEAGSDAQTVAWFPVEHLPELAFDHSEILLEALRTLKGAVIHSKTHQQWYKNILGSKGLRTLKDIVNRLKVDEHAAD